MAGCTGDNIFVVKGVELFTPAPYHGALDGITTNETTLTRYDLYNADECFMTGTGAEIIPVIKMDGRAIGDGKPGRITEKLVNGFKALGIDILTSLI